MKFFIAVLSALTLFGSVASAEEKTTTAPAAVTAPAKAAPVKAKKVKAKATKKVAKTPKAAPKA